MISYLRESAAEDFRRQTCEEVSMCLGLPDGSFVVLSICVYVVGMNASNEHAHIRSGWMSRTCICTCMCEYGAGNEGLCLYVCTVVYMPHVHRCVHVHGHMNGVNTDVYRYIFFI